MPTDTDIARVCHEANRAWQHVVGDPAPSPTWEDAPDWQRQAAIDGVRQASAGATPPALHQAWCRLKTADGWRYGPVKDPVAKTHPSLVAYDDLPPAERLKDTLFHAIVSALAAADRPELGQGQPAAEADREQGPDPRDGHLWTIAVTIRGAYGVRETPDAEPHDHEFSDYQSTYRPVQVQASDLRAALRRAAELPLADFLDEDEDEVGPGPVAACDPWAEQFGTGGNS